MPESRIKIGVIGVGRMGTYHANVLSILNHYVDFVGVYDIDLDRARTIATKYNTVSYKKVDDLLSVADGVCIAVPTRAHYDVAKRALEAGVHTLVEKPIACSIEEATALIELAEKMGLVFQVGHVERFKGAVIELKKIVHNPYLVEARRLSPWMNKDWDTGVVLDLMIHDIDIVLSLVKSEPVHIEAAGKIIKSKYEDVATAVLQFENGAIASITASRLSEIRLRRMTVSQKNGFILLDFESQDIDIHRRASASFYVFPSEITYKQEFIVEKVKVQKENALKEELLHFAKCIIGEEEPIVKGEDDIKTLEVTLRIIESINKKIGQPGHYIST